MSWSILEELKVSEITDCACCQGPEFGTVKLEECVNVKFYRCYGTSVELLLGKR